MELHFKCDTSGVNRLANIKSRGIEDCGDRSSIWLDKWGWEMRKVKRARSIMRRVFKKDQDFKRVYVDNVASCLEINGYSGIDRISRNAISEKIINLIFGIE